MLGVAAIASRLTPQARFDLASKSLRQSVDALEDYLRQAGEGKRSCVAATRIMQKGSSSSATAASAVNAGAAGTEEYFLARSDLARLNAVAERHCVRDKAVRRDALRIAMGRGKVLDGLGGATKVCMEYARYQPSGKIRCSRWTSGPGYLPGPQAEESYRIEDVREEYAERLCEDTSNKKKCGLARKYHYRGSLPYLPREKGGLTKPIAPIGKKGAVKIIRMGPAMPLLEAGESAH